VNLMNSLPINTHYTDIKSMFLTFSRSFSTLLSQFTLGLKNASCRTTKYFTL